MMTTAEHHQVVHVGRAAMRPVHDVVRVAHVVRAVAAGKDTAVVSHPQIGVLGRGHRTRSSADSERRADGIGDHRCDRRISGEPTRGVRTESGVEVAGQLRAQALPFARM